MIWISKRKKGGWTLWFPAGEVTDLVKLPGELRKILQKPDFSDRLVARLFPPAYQDDPDAEAEYQHLLREDLLQRKLEGIEAFDRTLRKRRENRLPFGLSMVEVDLTDGDLTLWLGFLHDMRLVIGTKLDITDESWEEEIDPGDPDAGEYQMLHRLAYLEEAILQALRKAENLP
jgi:hypothetical protein